MIPSSLKVTGIAFRDKPVEIELYNSVLPILKSLSSYALSMIIFEVNGCRVIGFVTILPSTSLYIEFPKLYDLACFVLLYTSCNPSSEVKDVGKLLELTS